MMSTFMASYRNFLTRPHEGSVGDCQVSGCALVALVQSCLLADMNREHYPVKSMEVSDVAIVLVYQKVTDPAADGLLREQAIVSETAQAMKLASSIRSSTFDLVNMG